MPPEPQRTQEQSIKARKHQLYEADARTKTGPDRSFRDCLKETPAAPLSTPIKALLWTVGTLVILLLIVALATGGNKKAKPKGVGASLSRVQALA